MSVAGDSTVLRHRNGFTPLYSLSGRACEVWNGESFQSARVVRCAHPERLLTFYFSNGLVINLPKRAELTIVDEETGDTEEILAGHAKIGMHIAPYTDQDGNDVQVYISSIKDREINEIAFEVASIKPVPFQVFLVSPAAPADTVPSPL